MGSLSGLLHRPLSAAAVVALATVSSDVIPDKFGNTRTSDTLSGARAEGNPLLDCSTETNSWISSISISNISKYSPTRVRNHADVEQSIPNTNRPFSPNLLFNSTTLLAGVLPGIHTIHQYAKIVKPLQTSNVSYSLPSSSPDSSYKWHLPDPSTTEASSISICRTAKSQTVVVLLGWLGAKQKHLKRYADWYTSRGFHVVTFTYPMADVLSYKVGGDAEKNVELLANHLAEWISEDYGKNLVFHTFSNTGWLSYGAIIEKFQKQDPCLMERIKGCIVDSAPVAAPDPQVWALGFSTAILKKRSLGTKGSTNPNDSKLDLLVDSGANMEPKPAIAEVALLALLEKIFAVVLNLPSINRRLTGIVDVLSSDQPKCPQLYVYSSSDRVIPVKSVESFVERQRKAGHEVRACDFISSPHVDHFRNHPNLYTSQLTTFLEDLVFTCCKDSS